MTTLHEYSGIKTGFVQRRHRKHTIQFRLSSRIRKTSNKCHIEISEIVSTLSKQSAPGVHEGRRQIVAAERNFIPRSTFPGKRLQSQQDSLNRMLSTASYA